MTRLHLPVCLAISLTACCAQEQTSWPHPVGRFWGSNRGGEQGSPLDGTPYIANITIDANGGIFLHVPKFDCGNIEPAIPTVLEQGRIEWVYINEFGDCVSPTTISLVHKSGSQWDYRWDFENRYGQGLLTFQCSNEHAACDEGSKCNSALSDTRELGACIPLGENFPLGSFYGSSKEETDEPSLGPYDVNITVTNNGGILFELPESSCRNENPAPPNIFEQGRLEWIHMNERGNCFPAKITMSHRSGSRWGFRWKYLDRQGTGVLTFQCSNKDCSRGTRCNSILPGDAASTNLNECISLGENFPVGTFFGWNKAADVGQPVTGDSNAVKISVNRNGGIIFERLDSSCGNVEPLPPNVFEDGKLKWIHHNQKGTCNRSASISLTHLSGSRWDYRWRSTTRHGAGVLMFNCSNDECDSGGTLCNSVLDKGNGRQLGDCVPLGDNFPVGTFFGWNRAGSRGEAVSGDPYQVKIVLDNNGGTILELPELGCGNVGLEFPSVFGDGILEFIHFNERGSCSSASLVSLIHNSGSEWNYRWENGDRYGVGLLTFQCLNSTCSSGNRCNSVLVEDSKTNLGDCIPLGENFPVGTFFGTYQLGDEGGTVTGDPYSVSITVNRNGGILFQLPEVRCGNIKPSPPNIFRRGELEWVFYREKGDCGFDAAFISLNHNIDDQWDFLWEYGNRFGVGILTFQCSNNNCEVGYGCNSILSTLHTSTELGECILGATTRSDEESTDASFSSTPSKMASLIAGSMCAAWLLVDLVGCNVAV